MGIMTTKKLLILFSIFFVYCSLSSCRESVKTTNSYEPQANTFTEPFDYMSADYELVELTLPDEFKVSGDYSLQQGTFDGNNAYFQTIDKTVNRMYATKDMYLYHVDTEEYEKVKSYDASKGARVLDFQIIDSDLYEIRFTPKGEELIYEIVYNGEVLQQHTVQSFVFTSEFTNVNGKLQYMVASIQGERTILYLYELDKGKIKELFSDDITLMEDGEKYNKWYFDTANQNSKSLLSFVINDNITERFYVYDGKDINEVIVPFKDGRRIFQMVPLKEGVFFISFIPPKAFEEIQYHYYDHTTKTISEVTGDTRNDMMLVSQAQISDNSFLFSTNNKKTAVGTIRNNKLDIRILDKIPDGIKFYKRVSDNVSLINATIYNQGENKSNEDKLFKIVWKEKSEN